MGRVWVGSAVVGVAGASGDDGDVPGGVVAAQDLAAVHDDEGVAVGCDGEVAVVVGRVARGEPAEGRDGVWVVWFTTRSCPGPPLL
jgi:hypothetical protein